MQIIREFQSIAQKERPVHCAIGMFDGLHQGHQALLNHIIKQAKADAGLALVMTFQEHPARVLAPEHAPGLIYPQALKESLLAVSGLDIAWIIPFDEGLRQLDGTSFIRQIKSYCRQLAEICVGNNFAFGHRRSGNIELLKQLGREWGFRTECKSAVTSDGEAVSSTRIRSLLSEGDINKASKLLGRHYCLAGEVIKGDGLGRKLGFRTANINSQSLALPKSGVYAVEAIRNGMPLRGVLNIGTRPTLNHAKPCIQAEVHFLDFDGDIYGEFLSLELKKRIRDEQRFPDVQALQQQIRNDIQKAKSLTFE